MISKTEISSSKDGNAKAGALPWWVIVAADAGGAAEGVLIGSIIKPYLDSSLPDWAVYSACGTVDAAASSVLTFTNDKFTLAGVNTLLNMISEVGSVAKLLSGK